MAKDKSSSDQLGLFGPASAKAPTDQEEPAREQTSGPTGGHRAEVAAPRRTPSSPPEVLTVARLDHLLRRVVEGATTNVRVQGEVSGLHRAGSGHLYFALKDQREDALIDCVMYRTAASAARNALRDGENVVLGGRVTLYAPRGRLQLIADRVLQTKRGELLEAQERLKKKLAAEGLFEASRKKTMPPDPQRVAVLTSRSGAAIHDVIRVAFRRGSVHLVLVPTPVQGHGSAERIARAIAFTDGLGLDAMVVTRGGGSAEDLAAYNEEVVVRAIAACRTPVLSAVGHEVDVSLSDLVADARAATPSQAAEMLVPHEGQRRDRLGHLNLRLEGAMRHQIVARREHAGRLWAAIEEPRRLLLERSQRFDELAARMTHCARLLLAGHRTALDGHTHRLHAQHPRRVTAETRQVFARLEPQLVAAMRQRLALEGARLLELTPRTTNGMRGRLTEHRQRLEHGVARLDAMSPLKVLARGYAIATDREGRILTDSGDVRAGERIRVRLNRGTITATVDESDGESRA